jgi:cytochrome c peroxidase
MIRWGSQGVGNPLRAAVVAIALCVGLGSVADDASAGGNGHKDRIPNNHPHPNPGGKGATFSTQGFIDLDSEYFKPQGQNGRSCGSCHLAEEAWAITPRTVQRIFDETDGLDPIFNPLDANNPNSDFSTEQARRAAYSMLLNEGLFRRGGAPAGTRGWDLTAVDDPHGFANLTRLVHWRRAMPTINFRLGPLAINWDGSNTDPRPAAERTVLGGLENQARRNVNGGQGGPLPPGTQLPAFPLALPAPYNVTIPNIVNFEFALFTAQLIVPGVGRLDSDGAKGGPEALSEIQTQVAGPFNLFDAWEHSGNPRRRQIFRGQQLFNNKESVPNQPGELVRKCSGCHNSQNNGTNVGNVFFNIETASVAARTPGLTLHTFCKRPAPTTPCTAVSGPDTMQLTDAGRGNVTGLWTDLGRFKTPTIRGLAARAPYFHNGIAKTIEDVVRHYETFLDFQFTDQERADLVAFLNAL